MLLALWLFYSDVQYIVVWRWIQHCTVYISGVVSDIDCVQLYLQRCEYFGTTLFSDVSYNVVSRYIFYNIVVVWFVQLQSNDVLSTATVSRAKP